MVGLVLVRLSRRQTSEKQRRQAREPSKIEIEEHRKQSSSNKVVVKDVESKIHGCTKLRSSKVLGQNEDRKKKCGSRNAEGDSLTFG